MSKAAEGPPCEEVGHECHVTRVLRLLTSAASSVQRPPAVSDGRTSVARVLWRNGEAGRRGARFTSRLEPLACLPAPTNITSQQLSTPNLATHKLMRHFKRDQRGVSYVNKLSSNSNHTSVMNFFHL